MTIWLSQLPKPQELKEYKKCPAVTSGGKSHFWVRVSDGITEWVVWNRLAQQWNYQIEASYLQTEISAVNWDLEQYFCLEPGNKQS